MTERLRIPAENQVRFQARATFDLRIGNQNISKKKTIWIWKKSHQSVWIVKSCDINSASYKSTLFVNSRRMNPDDMHQLYYY